MNMMMELKWMIHNYIFEQGKYYLYCDRELKGSPYKVIG